MNISEPFVTRPVGTTLLTIAIALAGILAFQFLPVSPLPQVEFPTIQVSAGLPGASPETMASAVATPLERQFGRIAGITEMTSSSSTGSTSIVMQFDLSRNIDGAARDVQAAINAARGQLPSNLPNNPTYRKVNPADAPILILSLTSDTVDSSGLYDAASSVLAQKLSQVEGVGQVTVGGSSLPAVRVELNPLILNRYGIGLDQVRTVLSTANANRPKGSFEISSRNWEIGTNDQLLKASQYRGLIISYHNGSAVRLSDVAEVTDSVQDLRNAGLANGKPAVSVVIFRQTGANIIDTVDRVRELLPQLRASISPAIDLTVMVDRTTTIRASVKDIEVTLLISIALVVLVVFAFLRKAWATFIPGVAVPVSLIGTFGVMYLLGYSLDNLSLMALTISTGFVVDDAIVVIENISRYIEQGMPPMQATLRGSKEIGFTVLSMSTSLVAVFIPILLMGGIVGRLFREFAVTLSIAIAMSLIVSLTTTPMMCARFLKAETDEKHGRLYMASEWSFDWLHRKYTTGLTWVLNHQRLTLAFTIITVCLNVYLYTIVPKGFFPDQDTGRLTGTIQAAQNTSFQALSEKVTRFVKGVMSDPAVDAVVSFTGGGGSNTARMFIALKPLDERKLSATEVIARLRKKLANVPGATLYLQPVQDIRVGGRASNASLQYTLQGDNLAQLNEWAPRVLREMVKLPEIADANSDQQNKGLEADLVIDRDTAARLGISASTIDEALYDAFGQRQVSTLYTQLNQYHVVMEVAPQYWQSPETLKDIYVHSSTGNMVPLSAFTHYAEGTTPLSVNHQSQFPSITMSFNLAPGVAMGDAVNAIQNGIRQMGLPQNIRASFSGTAQAFQESLANEPILILAALLTVYIVLGVLYESLIHPITILSTLPSAGVGALLALMIFKTELTVIAVIGIILLIGIVKKNAILMIDFAIDASRKEGKDPRAAIYEASLLRFRPIMMTTMAALLAGLPLALGTGVGSELRRPLGISIVGGLIVSQMLTLFTTPVVYLYMERFRFVASRLRHRRAKIQHLGESNA
ncbi:MAG: multidrug transporter subunit MdtC [Acidobacteria bacterium]|nr:MAG: multidrug transporter subunit MdtC [Acidobacteriota bacterium]